MDANPMTIDDVLREILINRVFLIILLFGGGIMFAFVGVMAFWSVQIVKAELAEWRTMSMMLGRRLKELEEKQK